MKRQLTTAVSAVLAILILYACASTIRTATTSFVTVTIGGLANTAVLKAEAATPWARFKYYLADAKLMPEAQAYIPSVVTRITVTVTAPDITTPTGGFDDIKPGQTSSTIRIEVPNGLARKFTVEGIHGVTSQVTYRASTEADLDGTDITLPITMQFNFFGSAIFVDAVNGSDQVNSGLTYTSPLQTITKALDLQSATTGTAPYTTIPVIYVEQGDYIFSLASQRERFPLQLNSNTAIICGGKGFTSVIGSGALPGTTIIRGNTGASIDNCKIAISAESSIAVTDAVSLQPVVATSMKVNGSWLELSNGGTSLGLTGAILYGDSTILESSITGTILSAPNITGVVINGGKPQIIDSTISNITAPNGIGIVITGNARPTIIGNIIRNNTRGIAIPSGDGDIIGNQIRNNSQYGIDISSGGTGTATGIPKINGNSIYCNGTDVNVVSNSVLDMRNNSWDHDAGTIPPGPAVSQGFIGGGYDIIYSIGSPAPNYVPFSAAVSGGCTTISVAKPVI